MKRLSIIALGVLVALVSCTKSKEVHPELGDGNDEIVTVGTKDVHVEYTRTDHADLSRVVFHYSLTETQPFEAATMTKKEGYFELALNNLLSDTLYHYYYELFPNNGNATLSGRKTFHTMASNIPEPMVEVPTVRTGEVTDITANTAKCSGEVINDGGGEVTERGICWSNYENPTMGDNHLIATLETSSFSVELSSLEANTTYHFRAYATNEAGTAYGLDKEFTTLDDFPEGAIDGLFTVNDNGDKVRFSQGNLQYQASTNTWRFAEHQWDYVGNGNTNISETYDGWIDLFGWGTSGYDHGAVCYQPWSVSVSNSDYNAYGLPTSSLFDQTRQADWGYNAISNGGNQEDLWHTLTRNEINYITLSRNTLSGMRYAKATVNDVTGLILLPDDWTISIYELIDNDLANASFSSNIIDSYTWVDVFESNGAVFMPVTGQRHGYSCSSFEKGLYWLSTSTAIGSAYNICFDNSSLIPDDDCSDLDRYAGRAVRLVQDANR